MITFIIASSQNFLALFKQYWLNCPYNKHTLVDLLSSVHVPLNEMY